MLHDLKQRLGDWLYFRRTLRALHEANDGLLSDAGISRRDIKRIAYEAVYRPRS